ncbi:DUF3224 domain-containing protein [Geothrix terrae]|uniref:DUF3224 domain-containing protein n=1 Tax=Geothrix terrae TaxID=2922720 RepID=UPI001FACEC31|nr:DUF3224 domain-containing protein [Geothrix terrae]
MTMPLIQTSLALLFCLGPQAPAIHPKEAHMTALATGSFDVKLVPLTEGVREGVWSPGRMSIDKRFKGDLEATSQGEMLAAGTEVQGSAGYTAIEQVRGTLRGRSGTFLLQHFAVMSRGVPGDWVVMVVPDSGTGDLKGLEGRMTILIEGGRHTYTLEYSLPGDAASPSQPTPQR